MQKEFNLIDEPWIKVMRQDKTVSEVGLMDVITDSDEYVSLAGETKSQDMAILRLLLAIVHTVFMRYAEDGSDYEPSEDDDAYATMLDKWEAVWKNGKMPCEPFEQYFGRWRDRFWLFDDEHPFFQCNAVKDKSKPISTSKLIGSLFESDNKPRLFAERNNDGRKLSFPEAARWLLHINSFDDIAAKQPTPKKTWCSQLGLIAVKGKDLFETIMLNYVADADIENSAYESCPSWEQEQCTEFNREIAIPKDQAELLSLQSRRLYLYRENDNITGYFLSGGDYFEQTDIKLEQMTIWRDESDKKDSSAVFAPLRHDPSKKAWREFGAIAAVADKNKDDAGRGIRVPGVIKWIKAKNIKTIMVETASVVYDLRQKMSLPVIDVISDTISFHSSLLDKLNIAWISAVEEEIALCDKAASCVYKFSTELQKASGASGDKLTGENEKAQFYDRIDRPFRLWLEGLDPAGKKSVFEKKAELNEQIFTIAVILGSELVENAGTGSILGRRVINPGASKKEMLSSASAYNIYVASLRKILGIKAGDTNDRK